MEVYPTPSILPPWELLEAAMEVKFTSMEIDESFHGT